MLPLLKCEPEKNWLWDINELMYSIWNDFIHYSQFYAEFKIKDFGEVIGNRPFPINDCFSLLGLSRPLGFKRRKKNKRLHYHYRWKLALTFSGYLLTFSNIWHLTFAPAWTGKNPSATIYFLHRLPRNPAPVTLTFTLMLSWVFLHFHVSTFQIPLSQLRTFSNFLNGSLF